MTEKYKLATPSPQYEKRRGRIIEKLSNEKTGRSAELRLNSSMEFSCLIDGLVCTSKDGQEVRWWAAAQLKKVDEKNLLEWIPVIHVKSETGGSHRWHRGNESKHNKDIEFKVSAHRFYVARKKIAEGDREWWMQLEWEQADPNSPGKLPDADMLSNAREFRSPREDSWGHRDAPEGEKKGHFRLPSKGGSGEGSYYVAYTGDLWKGIIAVIKQVKDAAATVDEMFRTKAGHEMLVALAQGKAVPLLGSGKK